MSVTEVDWFDDETIDAGQLTLGQVIALLEAEDPEKVVPVGFTHPHSYRGTYYELAFEPAENVSVGAMLADAKRALGATFEGYKGGEYKMDEGSDCWLAYYGRGGGETIGRLFLRLILEGASK